MDKIRNLIRVVTTPFRAIGRGITKVTKTVTDLPDSGWLGTIVAATGVEMFMESARAQAKSRMESHLKREDETACGEALLDFTPQERLAWDSFMDYLDRYTRYDLRHSLSKTGKTVMVTGEMMRLILGVEECDHDGKILTGHAARLQFCHNQGYIARPSALMYKLVRTWRSFRWSATTAVRTINQQLDDWGFDSNWRQQRWEQLKASTEEGGQELAESIVHFRQQRQEERARKNRQRIFFGPLNPRWWWVKLLS